MYTIKNKIYTDAGYILKYKNKIAILVSLLRSVANNLNAGNSNITEDEMIEICEMVSTASNPKEKISKYQTADMLGVNHKIVDYYVKNGYIPKGRQEIGFKEIFDIRKIY